MIPTTWPYIFRTCHSTTLDGKSFTPLLLYIKEYTQEEWLLQHHSSQITQTTEHYAEDSFSFYANMD